MHVLQGATNYMSGHHDLARKKAQLLVQMRCSRDKARSNLEKELEQIGAETELGRKLRVLSPNLCLSLSLLYGLNGGIGGTGLTGVYLAMLLCDTPPTLFGFSTLRTDYSLGFVHYHRGSRQEPTGTKMLKFAVFLHLLSCLGLVRYGADMRSVDLEPHLSRTRK